MGGTSLSLLQKGFLLKEKKQLTSDSLHFCTSHCSEPALQVGRPALNSDSRRDMQQASSSEGRNYVPGKGLYKSNHTSFKVAAQSPSPAEADQAKPDPRYLQR
uniref:Uncharacterized protein n=1 Tax=Sphaerodactylus townsendi TaxID=933632 RepID=A0ACB8ECF7_9SAUR